MSETRSHEAVVGSQFGTRAEAYLKSAVHAQGEDLRALAAIVAERPGSAVLDLGCGGGHVTFHVAPHSASVTACDLSEDMLRVVAQSCRERGLSHVQTRQAAAESLPFEDNSFDIVLSRYSAHHWHDFGAGLREAARVLKPGGLACFVDSLSPGRPLLDTYLQSIEILRDCSHVRSYARSEWQAAIAAAGLRASDARQFRLRLEFPVWIERMRTPKVQADAIRALQRGVSAETTGYFETEADGSFTFDIGFFVAAKPAS